MRCVLIFLVLLGCLTTACETTRKPAVYTRPSASTVAIQPVVEKPAPPPVIYFSGKTNADLILDSVLALPLPPLNLPSNAHVSIGSIDAFRDAEFQEYPARYNPINLLIEDALTMKLSTSQNPLVEKDFYTLARLFEVDGYYPNPLLPHVLQEKEGLSRVNYILSFRVLECGVRYVNLDKKLHDHYPLVKRLALTKVHLRLIDSKTGAITWSDILTGQAQEETPETFISQAEDGQYRFFDYHYPARTADAIKGAQIFPPISERNKPEKPSLVEKLIGTDKSDPSN